MPESRRAGRFIEPVVELWHARDIVVNLVRRDLKVRHRRTILGFLWSLTTPLLTVGVYTLVFSVLFQVATAPETTYPFAVYLFAGLVLWNFFLSSVSAATSSVVGAGYLLRKLYFPRAVLPLTSVLSSLVTMGFELSVLIVVSLAFKIWPTPYILYLPVIVLIVAAFSFGLALMLSAVTVFFKDIEHFIGIALQLWFWGTPIIYSLSITKSRPIMHNLLLANPMTGMVVGFRNALLDGKPVNPWYLGYASAMALLALALGTLVFSRTQRLFSELV